MINTENTHPNSSSAISHLIAAAFPPGQIEDGENVSSEDFDPGYGCVPVNVPKIVALPPMPKRIVSKRDAESWAYLKKTHEQKNREQDEYLASKGIF
ncbi:MAG: hypothetical protein WKF88_05585 [Ferruginibacter sp.]